MVAHALLTIIVGVICGGLIVGALLMTGVVEVIQTQVQVRRRLRARPVNVGEWLLIAGGSAVIVAIVGFLALYLVAHATLITQP